MVKSKVIVIIPNWNGADELPAAVDSLLAQTYANFELLIVDNGSTDNSKDVIESYKRRDKRLRSHYRAKNYGYTGGVNPGFDLAIREGAAFAATINCDAVADKHWLGKLVQFLTTHPGHGIATCLFLSADGKTIDSTGEEYTTWGLPYPRDRGKVATKKHPAGDVFGASGGASLYRVSMIKTIGTFDQDFFAYYEDIDLGFRAQLAGWKVGFVPEAIAYHERGTAAGRQAKLSAGDHSTTPFLTKQFMKNVPFVLVKNMPRGLLVRILPRFVWAFCLFFAQAVVAGRGGGALRGIGLFWVALPRKLRQRWAIQKTRSVSADYLWGSFVHDLPPNAHKLKKLRFWR